MNEDPCSCDVQCPHGQRCAGGHANYPESHWWPTCDDGCTPPDAIGYRLAHPAGQVIMVVSGCGHALGPGPVGEVSLSLREHRLACVEAQVGPAR